jgi:hypothetical protein
MKIVFLDFDGVLNNNDFLMQCRKKNIPWGRGHIVPEAVKLVDDLCARTGAKVVISSTWRIPVTPGHKMGIIGETKADTLPVLREWLAGHGLRAAVIDATPDHAQGTVAWWVERGLEIEDWLNTHRAAGGEAVESVVILDDLDNMRPHLSRLVQTDDEIGLTQAHVERAVALLESSPEADARAAFGVAFGEAA